MKVPPPAPVDGSVAITAAHDFPCHGRIPMPERTLRSTPLLVALFALLAAVPASLSAQAEVSGRWEGLLTLPQNQGALTMVFEIEAGEAGLTTTMFSPDQTDQAIPTGTTTFEEGKLVIEIPAIQGRYEGTLNEDGAIEGTWYQGPVSLPLNIEKADG